MQLPSLERLDLTLDSVAELPNPDIAAALGESLPLLGGLMALALQAGSMHGHLRHLRLPPSIKASVSAPFVRLLVCKPDLSDKRMLWGTCSNGCRLCIRFQHCKLETVMPVSVTLC